MHRNSTFVKWTIYFLFGLVLLWGIYQVIGYAFMVNAGMRELNSKSIQESKREEIKFYELVNNLVESKKYAQAIQLLKKRIENTDESNPLLYQDLGSVYYLKGELDSAIILYSKAIESSDFYPEGYANRGFIFEKQGDFESAIKDYKMAASDDPNYNYELGLALEKRGQILDSYTAYLKYMEYDSNESFILGKVDSLEQLGIILKVEENHLTWEEYQNQ